MIVTLTPQDAIVPATVGLRRQIYALSQRLPNYGYDDDLSFDHHIFGAMAEFVVARVLNLFWEPHVGMMAGIDVGGRVGVRLRRLPGNGTDLAIRVRDKDGMPLVLVHNRGDLRFELIGWAYPSEGKTTGVWNERCNVWFVPPPYRPIDDLVAMCARDAT